MDVKDAVKKRRSIRKYTNRMPKDADVQKVLQAGIWAPSGLNNQPWKFRVLKEEEGKDALAAFTESGDVIEEAPIAICVFLDKKASYNRNKDIMAIGACIQNILLQAHELGLATCWLGEILNKSKEVEKYLKLDSRYELMAVVALGYPDKKEESKRKNIKTFLLR